MPEYPESPATGRDVRRPPSAMRIAVAGCLVLAVASLALPFSPSYDPWAWLLWGREALGLGLDTSQGPSWKPLPLLFTTAFAAFGDAAPELWLVLSRAGWLLSLVLAWRLGSRLAGPAGSSLAGLVAAAGLLLIHDPDTPWMRQFAHGISEPLALAALLGAVDRHLDGHRGQAVWLAAAAALVRPEAWPLALVYVLHRARGERSQTAVLTGAGVLFVLVPGLWLVPDLLASGDPFTGADRARVVDAAAGADLALARVGEVLALAFGLLPAPLWLGVVAGLVRGPERAVRWLAAGAAAWVAIVAVEAVLGFAGLARFLIPAGGILCVVAGAGVGRLAAAVGGARLAGQGRSPARFGPALAAMVLVLTLPFVVLRAADLPGDLAEAERRADDEGSLRAAVEAAGPRRVAECAPVGVEDGLLRPALAWQLRVPLPSVLTLPPGPAAAPPEAGAVVVREGASDRWTVVPLGCGL